MPAKAKRPLRYLAFGEARRLSRHFVCATDPGYPPRPDDPSALWLPLHPYLMRTDTGDGGVEARHHLVIAAAVGVMQPCGAAVGCRDELRRRGGQQVQ